MHILSGFQGGNDQHVCFGFHLNDGSYISNCFRILLDSHSPIGLHYNCDSRCYSGFQKLNVLIFYLISISSMVFIVLLTYIFSLGFLMMQIYTICLGFMHTQVRMILLGFKRKQVHNFYFGFSISLVRKTHLVFMQILSRNYYSGFIIVTTICFPQTYHRTL